MSSIIHRFTPPTCTLEITGNRSPLSRWTRQDIFQKIKFKLRFDDPRSPTSKQITIEGKQQDLLLLQTAVNHYTQEQLNTSFKFVNTQQKSQAKAKITHDNPYLKSQGLVNHKLFFGSLIHDSNTNNIKLSTVQLFDLVSALEAYQTKIATLPETKQSIAHTQKIVPLWGGIAAVAIAAIGITTILLKSPWQPNIASAPESQTSPQVEIPELDEIIPPPSPDTSPQPASKPKLTKPLTSANRLPPPPAVDIPKPKPDIPDPADYPLEDVARQSGLSTGINNSQERKTTTEQPQQSKIVVPDLVPKTKQEEAEIITPEKKIESGSSADITTSRVESESKLSVTESQKDSRNQIDNAITSELDTDGSNNSSVNAPQDESITQNSPLALSKSPKSSTPPSQIQEVVAYFENQWQPPADLNQSLEYRLLLNEDGSIKKVVPLGKASQLYLSKTNIPLNGESFMSPDSKQQSSRIRLLLNPDGRVQAFIE